METDSEVELVTRDVEVRSLNPAVKTRLCPSKTRKTKKKGLALKSAGRSITANFVYFELSFYYEYAEFQKFGKTWKGGIEPMIGK